MISVKTSLAFVISFVLAIIAYFISSAEFAAGFSTLLASTFVLLTTIALLVVSSLQSSAATSPTVTKREKAVSPSSVPSGDTATLYVGNLAYKANEETVKEFFETVGTVKSVRLVKDKRTGRRKGFGFIEIDSGDESTFISKLNESEFMERNIIVRPANEKQH
jgi:hypothetical protein